VPRPRPLRCVGDGQGEWAGGARERIERDRPDALALVELRPEVSMTVARRAVAVAVGAGCAALVPEALHGAEDVRAGIGPAVALIVLLGAQVVAIAAAWRGRRWAVWLLLAVAVGWIAGALLDHPKVFTDPAGFRDGWSSTLPVLVLIAFNVVTAVSALVAAFVDHQVREMSGPAGLAMRSRRRLRR
jgi:cobalamin synthase